MSQLESVSLDKFKPMNAQQMGAFRGGLTTRSGGGSIVGLPGGRELSVDEDVLHWDDDGGGLQCIHYRLGNSWDVLYY